MITTPAAGSSARAIVAAKWFPSSATRTVVSEPASMPDRAGSGGRASRSKHISGSVLGEMAGVRHQDRKQLHRGPYAEATGSAPALAEAVDVVSSAAKPVHDDRHRVPRVRCHLRRRGVIARDGGHARLE